MDEPSVVYAEISIHALREEGDCSTPTLKTGHI